MHIVTRWRVKALLLNILSACRERARISSYLRAEANRINMTVTVGNLWTLYLRQGRWRLWRYSAFISLLVGLFVLHNKSTGGFGWNYQGISPTQTWLDFGGDPDQGLDPGYDWRILFHRQTDQTYGEYSAATWRTRRENWPSVGRGLSCPI